MPPATALLFERIKGDRLLSPFTLIGGTALALHIGHRISQDLDFITTQDKLPRALLQRLAQNLQIASHFRDLRQAYEIATAAQVLKSDSPS